MEFLLKNTLIYFSMIPPLLLLGMITTMSGSSTRANWSHWVVTFFAQLHNFEFLLTASFLSCFRDSCFNLSSSTNLFMFLGLMLLIFWRKKPPGEKCVFFICVRAYSCQHLPVNLHLFCSQLWFKVKFKFLVYRWEVGYFEGLHWWWTRVDELEKNKDKRSMKSISMSTCCHIWQIFTTINTMK